MVSKRFPIRDPRTVSRDIPGVLDILFPRLTGALVGSLNKRCQYFPDLQPISESEIEKTRIHKAMLFEISVAYAEIHLKGTAEPKWEDAISIAAKRQRRHYDARIPDKLNRTDIAIADHAATNLICMLEWLQSETPESSLICEPRIPGMGWIASGNGDFSLGSRLIEVKHTNRNFSSRDFKQVLMYWLLNYSEAIEKNLPAWTHITLLNPRKNSLLNLEVDALLISASSNSNRVELSEQLRAVVTSNPDWN
ncbi:hypothetical protein [Thalassospira tepidiphila]|uniref:hypothetical protein n=1 Tax=Thalassospira tepidiphila TaxID=393657 RepID=UPI00291C8964|nr:hypothetical protein MACH01_14480 [Thalassospira tepidiphila]